MKVSQRLESRREDWQELEQLCGRLERGRRAIPSAANVSHFADLYRSACADLALADAYHLPPATVRFLHQLVGRAHNQLYRGESFRVNRWHHEVFVNVPQRLFADGCLRLAFGIFWGVLCLCWCLAWKDPDFAPRIVGKEVLLSKERQFEREPSGRTGEERNFMIGAYIANNGTIGLRCFAFGLLLGVGGLYETVFNAAWIGATFGFMAHSPNSANFFHFVTAHAPFELTAIVLMAAAGMRMGFALIDTRGRGRANAVYHAARQSVPAMAVGVALFMLAAAIEAFVSPSDVPYAVKAGVAIASTVMLVFYFVVLGYPGRKDDA